MSSVLGKYSIIRPRNVTRVFYRRDVGYASEHFRLEEFEAISLSYIRDIAIIGLRSLSCERSYAQD
jgi:hypothetical protein